MVLFLLYTADVTAIIQLHVFDSYSYADDTQVYGHCKSALCAVLINHVTLCIKEIEMWTYQTVSLNTYKTQFVWLGTKQQLTKVCC